MNKNVPERGMSKARWYELRGTTNGGLGRTLRERARFVHISQQYQPIYKDVEIGDGDDKTTIKVLDRYDPVYKYGKQGKGRSYKNQHRSKGKRGRTLMGRRRRARMGLT